MSWTNGDRSLSELVEAARGGDQHAWRAICERTKRVVWKVLNAMSLNRADAQDAFAATYFRLAEHLDRIREPEALPGWLATTARHEALNLLRSSRRVEPMDDLPASAVYAPDTAADELVDAELRAALRAAFALISARCQELLRLLTADPPLGYPAISELLTLPIGSIGPTRGRCLDELRRQPPLARWILGDQ